MKRYEKPDVEVLVFEENVMLEEEEIGFSGWEDGEEF